MNTEKKGTISIHAQNIMPIIKKWLYSDRDIFVREIISNGCDAIVKYKMLAAQGDAPMCDDYAVNVVLDKENNTITFTDNGIGMTAEEVEKYITQVAFSGAQEFLEKYKGQTDETNGIIGHFGLGFYSAFMAAEKVQIDTLSWQPGAEPVRWVSTDGMEYEMSVGGKAGRGTTITLTVNDECKEFLDKYRLREVMEKYCAFMPTPIYLLDVADVKAAEAKAAEDAEKKAEEKAKAEAEGGDITAESVDEDTKPAEVKPEQINDTSPLWLKLPKDCTDEEYKTFYHKVFHEYEDPLFWIHLNADYPFNLKGILYFPKLKTEFTANEGQIKLYSNQVFVADNIKEVIPEFLMLLKGTIDCPDLPLNVSRSFLQNDGQVKKMQAYITRKVAERLNTEFNTNRDQYQQYWNDINPFVKYGCIRDEKFYEKVRDVLLFKSVDGEYLTLKEYKDRNPEKHDKVVYYCSDPKAQAQSVELYKQQDITVVVLDALIDSNFISFMEYSGKDDTAISFKRVDSDVSGLTDDTAAIDAQQQTALTDLFHKAIGKDDLPVELKKLKGEALPAIVMVDEQTRRFTEMSKRWGGGFEMPEQKHLVLNSANPLVQFMATAEPSEKLTLMAKQTYDLAEMARQPLDGDSMLAFVKRSYELMAMLADK